MSCHSVGRGKRLGTPKGAHGPFVVEVMDARNAAYLASHARMPRASAVTACSSEPPPLSRNSQ